MRNDNKPRWIIFSTPRGNRSWVEDRWFDEDGIMHFGKQRPSETDPAFAKFLGRALGK